MTTNLPVATEIIPMVLQLQPAMSTTGYAYALTEDQFYEFCQLNRDFRIERNAVGELVIMSLTDAETSQRNFEIIGQLGIWTKQDSTGVGFGSSGGFTLLNGAVRSPDAAWIKRDRWEAIPSELRKKFAPICPEFVIELRSETDNLQILQDKMQEYIDNGTQLGWLIDRKQRQVFIYRPNIVVEQLDNPKTLNGDPLLLGFVLDLSQVW
ncbi:MAG: Uma2 family endonuclease [Nostoc sp. DedVER02]|uniref:Uma2 family endonuclease n=1 Tax=unclassified Nostoc TaxID=2593658 RepID=UPI002AD1F95A|nr:MULTISPECIES: Uma2 family endonuclease [unclassified Nostoc]MDZ7989407.1 Uma2 family endonuclease [Nostoc sp. DedVER02]MDZ8112318.1 Uma2 family endonuclease [Nostoc sp. DedVER01b]